MLDFRVDTFLCVCRHMNYTKASEELNITQPAVSQHIKYLEHYYGTRLFMYENKKLYLTSPGKILYERLNTLKHDEQKLREEVSACDPQVYNVSMGVTMTVGEYAIIDSLSEYIKRHPNVNLQIHFGNTEELLELLKLGKINLALVEGYYPKDDYRHFNYSNEKYMAVCSVNHKFAVGKPTRLSDLFGERLLVREKGSGTRNILERNLSIHGVSVEDFAHSVEIGNMHTIIGLLQRDCGISFLYEIAAREQIRLGVLKEIPLSDFTMEHEFDFIWEKGSLYQDKYMEFCRELL